MHDVINDFYSRNNAEVGAVAVTSSPSSSGSSGSSKGPFLSSAVENGPA